MRLSFTLPVLLPIVQVYSSHLEIQSPRIQAAGSLSIFLEMSLVVLLERMQYFSLVES